MKNTVKNLHTVWAEGFGPPYMSCCYNTVFCLKRIIDFQRMSTCAPSHVVTSTMAIFTQFTIVSFVQQVLNLKTDFPVCSGFLLGVQLICMLNRSSQNIWMHVSNRLRPGAERFLVTILVCGFHPSEGKARREEVHGSIRLPLFSKCQDVCSPELQEQNPPVHSANQFSDLKQTSLHSGWKKSWMDGCLSTY